MAGLTFVQATNAISGAGVTSFSKAYTSNTTGSSYLLAFVLTAGLAANTVTVTDTLSNSWTQIGTAISDGTNEYNLFQCPSNNASGGACTVTCHGSSTLFMLMIMEWTGQAVSSPLDASTTVGTSGVNSVTTSAILGNAPNEQYILAAWTGGTAGLTPSAGYTTRFSTGNAIVLDGFFATAASRTGGYTITSANTQAVFLVSVKSTTSSNSFVPQAGAFFVGF